MSSEVYTIKVFTPAGLVLEDQATTVTLPGEGGEMGVLPGHVKYTGLLGTGVLQYSQPAAAKPVRIVVSGGFCTFADSVLTVLADYVATNDSFDEKTYAVERENLQKLVDVGSSADHEYLVAKAKLARIEAIDRLRTTH